MGPILEQREAIADALADAANKLIAPLLEAARQLPPAGHMLEGKRLGDAGLAVQRAFAEARELADEIVPFDQLRSWLFDVTGLFAGHGIHGHVSRYCTVTPGADVHVIAGALNDSSPLKPWHPLLRAPGVEQIKFPSVAEQAETIARLQEAARPKKTPGFERIPDWSIAKAAG
jgi:hypothetical protein